MITRSEDNNTGPFLEGLHLRARPSSLPPLSEAHHKRRRRP